MKTWYFCHYIEESDETGFPETRVSEIRAVTIEEACAVFAKHYGTYGGYVVFADKPVMVPELQDGLDQKYDRV